MNVRELMAQLEVEDPEMTVCVIVGDCDDLEPVDSVSVQDEDWTGPGKVLVIS